METKNLDLKFTISDSEGELEIAPAERTRDLELLLDRAISIVEKHAPGAIFWLDDARKAVRPQVTS